MDFCPDLALSIENFASKPVLASADYSCCASAKLPIHLANRDLSMLSVSSFHVASRQLTLHMRFLSLPFHFLVCLYTCTLIDAYIYTLLHVT